MLDAWLIAIGFGIGVLVSAPVGAANIMCLTLSLQSGFRAGMAVALGAVFADVLFALAAAFGVTAVVTFIEGHSGLIQIIGGALLILFGLVLVFRSPEALISAHLKRRNGGSLSVAATAFTLCITNPALLFAFLAIFSGLGDVLEEEGTFLAPALLVLGVGLGSFGWYAGVSAIASHWRSSIRPEKLRLINILTGIALLVFGGAVLLNAAYDLVLKPSAVWLFGKHAL